MRKISKKHRLYLIRRNEKRWRRRRSRDRRKQKRTVSGQSNAATTTTVSVKAPAHFNLYEKKPRRYFLKFLNRIRKAVSRKDRVEINFSNTVLINPDAGVLFYAELYRLVKYVSGAYIRCSPPKDPKIHQVLDWIGVYKLLKYRSPPPTHDHPQVIHWRVAHGEDARGDSFEELCAPYEGRVSETVFTEFFESISEAMTNARQHAYIDKRQDGLTVDQQEVGWWMFSQEKDNFLTVAFCDLGVGISGSLPKQKPKQWEEMVSRLFLRNQYDGRRDGQIIAEAIKHTRSRTLKKNRGKGLSQIEEVIRNAGKGSLTIYSNKGLYSFNGSNEKTCSNYKFRDCSHIIQMIMLPDSEHLGVHR